MLSHDGLFKRLTSGEVRITYAFDTRSTGQPDKLTPPAPVITGDRSAPGTQLFEQNFFAQRLSLTVGPLVLSHRYGWHRNRRRHKGMPGVFDLRLTNGSMDILPGESILVNSNEQIALGPSTGAITYPRLSHATAGLTLATSYIDPYWDGILVLQLVNSARRPITIGFGEKFAATMFYDVQDGPVGAQLKEQFAQKSHHYGLSWERILSSDFNPFPLRKQPAPSLLRGSDWTARDILARYGKPLIASGITGTVLVSGLVYIGRLQEELTFARNLSAVQQAQSHTLDQVVGQINQLTQARIRSGTVVVTIPAESLQGTASFPIPNIDPSPGGHVVLAKSITSELGAQTEAVLAFGATPNSATLQITLVIGQRAMTDRQIVVQYIIA